MKLFTRRFCKNFKTIKDEFVGKPINYLEIGVFMGYTSEWMLDNVLTNDNATYTGIDPWIWSTPFYKQFPTEQKWNECVLNRIESLKNKYGSKANFIRGYSQDVFRKQHFEDNFFDIIYIDGHHTIQCVLRDYVYTWPMLKINGVMIFDDYLQKNSDMVKVAVNVILQGLGERGGRRKRGSKYELLFSNRQIGIRKLAE